MITTDPPLPPAMMCGTAARIVFHWPVRLTSIISSHTSSSISRVGAGVEMPAFASTMSSRPSWATPSFTAASRANSRMATCDALSAGQAASTWLTVAPRSSGVAIG